MHKTGLLLLLANRHGGTRLELNLAIRTDALPALWCAHRSTGCFTTIDECLDRIESHGRRPGLLCG
jgi:hypothetical protein